MWRVVVRRSSGTLLKFSGLLIPIQLPQGTVHSSVIGFYWLFVLRPLARTPEQRKQNRRGIQSRPPLLACRPHRNKV